MPNIVEFRQPLAAPEPTDIAATTAREAGAVENRFAREAGTAIGGAVSRVGGQAGERIDRHVTAQWIGHGAATYSSLYGDLTQQWNELAAKSDPNDTSIKQGFQEKILGPSLEKFQQAFEGAPEDAQQWALTRTNELRQHFSEKMSADMGTRAAAAVHQNIASLEKNYSATVGNDPSTLPHITDSIKTDVEALISSHGLTAGDAARVRAEVIPKLQTTIAQSAFDGMAQRNPEKAIAALDHGDFNQYADEVTRAQWRRYADYQQKAQLQDDERQRVAEKRQRDDTANTALDEHITALQKGERGVISRAFADPRLAGYAHLKENVRAFSKQIAEGIENKPHPQERGRLQDLIYETAMTNPDDVELLRKDVLDSHKAGKLSNAEQVLLNNEITQAGDHLNQHIHRVVSQITDSAAMDATSKALLMLPEQADAFAAGRVNYESFVRDEFRKKIAAGQSVTPLFDPKSASSPLNPAVARTYLFPQTQKKAIEDAADVARKGELDIPAERAKVSAAIAAGVPDEAAKSRFKQRTGQDFEPVTQGSFEEFVAQQDALRPAVEAKGWKWEPDRWNYFVDKNGQIDREGSSGRAFMKAYWKSSVAAKAELDKLKGK